MTINKMSVRINKIICCATLAALLVPATVPAEPSGMRADCAEYFERLRRRPGDPPRENHPCNEPGLAPAVWGDLPYFAAIPDRWRIVNAVGYAERLWDPYNGNNVLKGDRPAFGSDWFVAFNLISDSNFEQLKLQKPVAIATATETG